MKRRYLPYVLLSTAMLFGCAAPQADSRRTAWRTTLVAAMGTATPGRIVAVSDKFTFDGAVHAHATLVAEGPVVPSERMFTMKWFNGNRQVHERSAQYTLGRTPYYLVHAVPGSVLGVGPCRVELHSQDGLLAVREFSVTER